MTMQSGKHFGPFAINTYTCITYLLLILCTCHFLHEYLDCPITFTKLEHYYTYMKISCPPSDKALCKKFFNKMSKPKFCHSLLKLTLQLKLAESTP